MTLNNKKNKVILFGILCIVLGFSTSPSNFIPSYLKYILGVSFILYAIFFIRNNSDETDK